MMYTGHKMVCTCRDGVVMLVLLIYTGAVVCLAEKWACLLYTSDAATKVNV